MVVAGGKVLLPIVIWSFSLKSFLKKKVSLIHLFCSLCGTLLQKEIFLFFFFLFYNYFTTRVNIPYFRKRGGKKRKQKSITSTMIALVLCIDIYSYNEEKKRCQLSGII